MDEDLVETLTRWTDSGAMWRVISRGATSVTIALCRCDGGEVVERLHSDDPVVLTWLGCRSSSEE